MAFELGIVEVGVVHYAGLGFLVPTEKENFGDYIHFTSSLDSNAVPIAMML